VGSQLIRKEMESATTGASPQEADAMLRKFKQEHFAIGRIPRGAGEVRVTEGN